jgi:hypothetical protein
MRPGASRSLFPRLSEACRLLPLIRDCLVAAAPRSLATSLELVPIVEDGLFGYELVADRDTPICPIIGSNARGEPVVRRNSYGVGAPGVLRMAAINGRLHSGRGHMARGAGGERDSLFPDWLAAAETAWAQFVPLRPEPPRPFPPASVATNRCLERGLLAARSHLARWDPYIGFFGIPNEAQLGFALRGDGGEFGELALAPPGTWQLRWAASSVVICESWPVLEDDLEAYAKLADVLPRHADRRARRRRATDIGLAPGAWMGTERRRGHERRAVSSRRPR